MVSGAPREPDEEATHETQSMFCFAFSLDLIPSSARQECVATELLVLRSPQFSLRLDREVRAGTNLCWQYACFSPTSEGSATSSQSKHWSGDCRVCRTCSAGPVVVVVEVMYFLCMVSATLCSSIRCKASATMCELQSYNMIL